MRHLAPAGAPIGAMDLARWARLGVSGGSVSETLQDVIRERFGVRRSFLTSTGRAGLTLLLRAMRGLAPAGRDEVILPSYTCFSVAASVVKAGLRPRIVDISSSTLDYAPDRLLNADFTRVLAVIATNLYGLPNDLSAISEVCKRHGVFLIDDAAQSMGASIGGKPCGTWGDAGLFSFDKGKNVSAIDGGILVTNSDAVATALEAEIASLPSPGITATGAAIAKALAYSLLLRPWLYGIPNSIPQLGLGKTVFTTDFPLERPSRALVGLGLAMMDRLQDFTRTRVANATSLMRGLNGAPGVRMILPVPGADPVYLRLPILIPDDTARRDVLEKLNAIGIGASGSYPASLADVDGLDAAADGPAPTSGRFVARHIVTLPTHAFMTPADINRTIDVVTAGTHAASRRSTSAA